MSGQAGQSRSMEVHWPLAYGLGGPGAPGLHFFVTISSECFVLCLKIALSYFPAHTCKVGSQGCLCWVRTSRWKETFY